MNRVINVDDLRFGIFLPPYHRTGQNPTLAIHRDLDLIELWDRLGFDEVWVGEHHSAKQRYDAEHAPHGAGRSPR